MTTNSRHSRAITEKRSKIAIRESRIRKTRLTRYLYSRSKYYKIADEKFRKNSRKMEKNVDSFSVFCSKGILAVKRSTSIGVGGFGPAATNPHPNRRKPKY